MNGITGYKSVFTSLNEVENTLKLVYQTILGQGIQICHHLHRMLTFLYPYFNLNDLLFYI